MKFYRYMSLEEFVKLGLGKNLQSNYSQQFNDRKTNSKGFCFLGSTTIGNVLDEPNSHLEFSPLECLSFLARIVSDEILVEFEGKDDLECKEGYGIYLNPYSRTRFDRELKINEYSLLEYNINVIKPLRFAVSPFQFSEQDVVWETFREDREYTLEEMIKSYIESIFSPNSNKCVMFDRNLKLLPTMPNSTDDNIWRIMRGKEDGVDSLVYGNPITEEEIFELRFDSKTGQFDFGENIPEFWSPLKGFCDKNAGLAINHIRLFQTAALVAAYPQILQKFDLVRIGNSTCLKNNDDILSTSDLFFTLKEDDTLDIIYYKGNDSLSLIEDILPDQSEHTASEIGEFASGINLTSLIQGLQDITSGEISREPFSPRQEEK